MIYTYCIESRRPGGKEGSCLTTCGLRNMLRLILASRPGVCLYSNRYCTWKQMLVQQATILLVVHDATMHNVCKIILYVSTSKHPTNIGGLFCLAGVLLVAAKPSALRSNSRKFRRLICHQRPVWDNRVGECLASCVCWIIYLVSWCVMSLLSQPKQENTAWN